MKKSLVVVAITGFLMLVSTFSVFAWTTDVRVTNASGNSDVCGNNTWGVAGGSAGVVHIVWADGRTSGSGTGIYHNYSTNNGFTWLGETRLPNSTYGYSPGIAVSGSNLNVAWWDGNSDNILYQLSTDAGGNWSSPIQVNSSTPARWPSIAINNNYVHIVWMDGRSNNYWEIYYNRTTDGGVHWLGDTRLTCADSTQCNCGTPSVADSGQIVHVAFVKGGSPGYEIWYLRSTDAGVHWSSKQRIDARTSDVYTSAPSIGASGAKVHAVWSDFRGKSGSNVFYNLSTDKGANWGSTAKNLSSSLPENSSACPPSIAVSQSLVQVVWPNANSGSGTRIYSILSDDGGGSWYDAD